MVLSGARVDRIFHVPDIASAGGCAILAHRAARTESRADDAFFRVIEKNFGEVAEWLKALPC
jgi:hypothetical protein